MMWSSLSKRFWYFKLTERAASLSGIKYMWLLLAVFCCNALRGSQSIITINDKKFGHDGIRMAIDQL